MMAAAPPSARPLLSIVIPAMNEGGSIGPVLVDYATDLRAMHIPFEIVVVNDVGQDNTEDVLQALLPSIPELRAFSRRGGKGYGSAVAAGIDFSRGAYVVISSADACNSSADIAQYYHALDAGHDAVFGSRFVDGGSATDYPPVKMFVNRVANFGLQCIFGFQFNDYTDGFKGYRRDLLEQSKPFFSTKFNITIELSLKAMLLTANITQVPTHWQGRLWGASKLSILKVLRFYLATLFFVIGLRLTARDFQNTARSHPVIDEIEPDTRSISS